MENRAANEKRNTSETEIEIRLNLDGTGIADVETGICFFNHLLIAFARHARFDLMVRAQGDLHVDDHHTVEDTAIVLGQVIGKSLGNKAGITRMGDAIVPMDEALALVAVDIGGRAYFEFDGFFDNPSIGQMATSMVPHFFESLSAGAKINIHARLLAGKDDHHRAEALFKALGRSLHMATSIAPGEVNPATVPAIECLTAVSPDRRDAFFTVSIYWRRPRRLSWPARGIFGHSARLANYPGQS